MPEDRQLLTTSQAAREFTVSQETVRRWIASGQLRAVTLPSGHHRVRRIDVEAILRGNTEPVAS